MSRYLSSFDEDRFLASSSFLRMVLLVIGGALLNAAVMYSYGYRSFCCVVNATTNVVIGNYVALNSDWRLLVVWIALFPIVWATASTYALPSKLRMSPVDLQIA